MSGALILWGLWTVAGAPASGAVPTATTSSTAAAPRIDLISIGVGSEMYAVFGHAAIRVVHPDGRDTAYNFGGVDMEQPNFWTRLIQGRMEAFLDVTPYSELLLKYSGEDRTIVGRTLRFTPEQARRVVERLEAIHASDDERVYLYHHIFDNCTTRAAGVFNEVLGGGLKAQGQYPVRGTHRDWILDRIHDRPLLYLAMDLAGNGMGDVPLVAWDTIFIPEALDTVIDGAEFDGKPFVMHRYLDYRSMSFDEPVVWDWPWTKVYLLLVLPLIGLAMWRPRVTGSLWGLIGGLIGWAYILFWIASDYPFYHYNWNMYCFPPTHLLLLVAAFRARWWSHIVTRRYVQAHAALLIALALGRAAGLIVQDIDPMLGVALPLSASLVALGWRTRQDQA